MTPCAISTSGVQILISWGAVYQPGIEVVSGCPWMQGIRSKYRSPQCTSMYPCFSSNVLRDFRNVVSKMLKIDFSKSPKSLNGRLRKPKFITKYGNNVFPNRAVSDYTTHERQGRRGHRWIKLDSEDLLL